MSKCDHCPLRDRETPCAAEAAGWSYLCEMAGRGDPVELRFIIDKSERSDASPAEYPPLATQAGNAIKAAVRFVGSGLAVVDRDEFDRRRAICEGCEFMDKARNRCTRCGCSIALKPWSKAESCPEGRW